MPKRAKKKAIRSEAPSGEGGREMTNLETRYWDLWRAIHPTPNSYVDERALAALVAEEYASARDFGHALQALDAAPADELKMQMGRCTVSEARVHEIASGCYRRDVSDAISAIELLESKLAALEARPPTALTYEGSLRDIRSALGLSEFDDHEHVIETIRGLRAAP